MLCKLLALEKEIATLKQENQNLKFYGQVRAEIWKMFSKNNKTPFGDGGSLAWDIGDKLWMLIEHLAIKRMNEVPILRS